MSGVDAVVLKQRDPSPPYPDAALGPCVLPPWVRTLFLPGG